MIATRITVDNVTYRVLVEYDTLKRSFDLMEGDNSGTAISGRSIRDILGTNYKYTMTVRADPDSPSDYDAFYWKISEPVDSHFISIPCGGNEYSVSIWEKGSIAGSTGADSSSSKRLRTKTYLNSSIKNITPLHGYTVMIYGYDDEDVYQGMWSGSAFTKTTSTWFSNVINLDSISNYNLKVVVKNPTNTNIVVDEATNIMLDVGVIMFEAKILSGSDKYIGYYLNHKYWDHLDVTFEPMSPQRLDVNGPDISKNVYDKF